MLELKGALQGTMAKHEDWSLKKFNRLSSAKSGSLKYFVQ